MIRTRSTVVLAVSALGVSLVSACGGGADAAPARANGTRGGQGTGNAPGVHLAARQIDRLGTVVTDSAGMTLYRFDKDTARPSESNCDGPCPGLWPPVSANASDVQVSGIDKGVIGTITRKDGTSQLTVNGWPVYRYARDIRPGDAKGQGVGLTWYAVTPKGSKAASTEERGSGTGY